MSEQKEILLKPSVPFQHYVEVAVIDFPKGREDGTERQRCKVRVEFGRADVAQLKSQGMDMEAAMEHYRDYLYYIVKRNIASDWTAVSGLEEVMRITEEHIAPYFRDAEK